RQLLLYHFINLHIAGDPYQVKYTSPNWSASSSNLSAVKKNIIILDFFYLNTKTNFIFIINHTEPLRTRLAATTPLL
ncbi:unnamed protein product, partial [Plutella xylostella]